MRVNLNELFVSNKLTCPPHLRRIEYVSKSLGGFFVEVRRGRDNYGTFYFRGKDLQGKTYTQKIGTTDDLSFSEAETECRRMKSEQYLQLTSGINPRGDALTKQENPTLNDYYESDYLPFIKQRNRSWKSTDGVYNRYVKPVFGDMLVKDIPRKMVVEFHAELKNRGLSGATADHALKCLRHIINTMILNGLASDNPAARVPTFNDFNEVNNVPNPNEFRKLMAVLNNSKSPVALIARMLILTGCRLSEITGATWNNCDLDKKILHIESTRSKSKLPREIPLSDEAINVLMQSGTYRKNEYLFVNPKSKTKYSSVHKTWNKLRTLAGLPKLRLHDLRHMAASELASQGESILVIARYLGHAQVSTAERYSHVSDSVLRRASNKISSAVQNAMDSDAQ